jgi:hypothetical protein
MSVESDSDQHPHDKVLHAPGLSESQPDNQWDVQRASKNVRTRDLPELIHYWFVQYNPLYFFSALCILGGVYFLALELDGSVVSGSNRDWSLGQVILFAVIQLYEFLLIAAAGFLVHKVGLMRPAVILTLLEGVFLFDCTFRLETISHLGIIGTVMSIIWVILVPVKTWLLCVALRLDMPRMVIWLVAGAGAGLALMLQTLGMPDADRPMVILAATWWGAALFAFAYIVKPRISRLGSSDVASDDMCQRIAKSLLILLGGIYFYHVINYVVWIGLDHGLVFYPMIGTGFLMVALLRASEREIWIGIAIALGTSLAYFPAAFPMAVLAAAVLMYRARQSGNARFIVGAVLCGYFATWVFTWVGGHMPLPPVWSAVVAGALLGYVAWKLREPTAVLALAVGGLGIAARFDFNPMLLLPDSRLGLGILLVGVGFVALTMGVWVNWCFRSTPPAMESGEDRVLGGSEAGA